MDKLFFCFLWFILCFSCTPLPLEKVLKESGENRQELEKVLKYYSLRADDSLKYQAACFLIENMSGHYWYEGEVLTQYRQWVDTTYPRLRNDQRQLFYQAHLLIPSVANTLQKKEDLRYLKSDFLIRHIERSFKAWKNLPWLEEFSFEDFCEYILPYRCAGEDPTTFSYVGDSLAMNQLLQTVEKYDDIIYDPNQVKEIYSPVGHYGALFEINRIRYDDRFIPFEPSECRAAALCELINHRSRQVPAAIDFTPAFPHLNNRHYWVSLIHPRILGGSTTLYENERVCKVYRKVFSHQPIPQYVEGEFIPPFFLDPFNKDVTDSYTSVTAFNISVKTEVKSRHVYLCVFNDQKWTPVAFAALKGRKAFSVM